MFHCLRDSTGSVKALFSGALHRSRADRSQSLIAGFRTEKVEPTSTDNVLKLVTGFGYQATAPVEAARLAALAASGSLSGSKKLKASRKARAEASR